MEVTKMCQMCKTLIYDILISPLSLSHLLRDYINMKALTSCAPDVTECFYRATCEFPICPEFFTRNEPYDPRRPLRIRIPGEPEFKDNYERFEFVWNRFQDECPLWFAELGHAIDLCCIEGVARKTHMKEELITQFFMEKLYILLANLPQIHNEHTLKVRHTISSSTGPVSLLKIIDIRQKAGLSVEKYLPKNVYHF